MKKDVIVGLGEIGKPIFKILSKLSDRPKGRGRTTPLFRYKIITGERLNIFA